jgi:hypothetical protein
MTSCEGAHLVVKGEALREREAALLETHDAQPVTQQNALVAVVIDEDAAADVAHPEKQQGRGHVEIRHSSDECTRVDECVKRRRPVGHRVQEAHR